MSTATQTLPAHKLASSGEKTTQKNVAPAINPHIAPVVAQAPMAANIKYGRINMEFFGFYQGAGLETFSCIELILFNISSEILILVAPIFSFN